jgi:TRAP-type transport system periplasmic protein
MKTLLLSVTVVLMFALVISGCSKQTTSSTINAPASTQVPTIRTQVQPIKLTFGSIYPATHPLEAVNRAWIDKIQKETNGRVQITLYAGGTLMHMFTAWDELKSGVADIATFSVAQAKGFPIGTALTTLIYGTDVFVARQIYDKLKADFPDISAELASVKTLQYRGLVSNYILTKKQVKTLADMKGMQIQGSPSFPGLAEKLGAASVTMPILEMYPSLQKGIIDGTMMPVDALKSLNLAEVTSFGVNMHTAAPAETFVIMNLNSWNRLPPDIQEVFENNIIWAGEQMINTLVKGDQDAIDSSKTKGFQFSELSQVEMDKLHSYMEEIALIKAANLDSQNLPGTKINNDIKQLKQQAFRKYNDLVNLDSLEELEKYSGTINQIRLV